MKRFAICGQGLVEGARAILAKHSVPDAADQHPGGSSMSAPESLRLTVNAGPHARLNTPCYLPLPAGTELPDVVALVAGKTRLPGQVERGPDGRRLHFILDRLSAGQSKVFRIQAGAGSPSCGVGLRKGKGSVSVAINGQLFTRYLHQPDLARPYLSPITGPDGVEMTRRIEKRGTPGYDHAHHRSVWVAHGLVNGTDNWSEEEGHGRTVHQDFEAMTSGPVTAAIAERCEWVAAAGRRILNEDRNIRFYALPESMRCVDFTITLKTGEDAVLFGDTKEGGMLSVRVNPQINAPAGTIENSFGGVNEDETWGKRAHWCDYSGTIDGVHAGIAILDHPRNLGHPVYWHVRNYGLMTANSFGVSHFEPESGKRGDWVMPAQSDVTFRYRLYVHAGDAARGRVREAYHDYVNPPHCSVASEG